MEKKVLGADLQLRDIVRTSNVPYGVATVFKIEHATGIIHLVRPFVKTEDFSYTGGVIKYLGYEEYPIWSTTEVTLLERPNDSSPLR